MGIEDHAADIVKVAEIATKEYSIEQTLDKMAAEWETNFMELTPYKQTGYIVHLIVVICYFSLVFTYPNSS